jgi:hypothetical protein
LVVKQPTTLATVATPTTPTAAVQQLQLLDFGNSTTTLATSGNLLIVAPCHVAIANEKKK